MAIGSPAGVTAVVVVVGTISVAGEDSAEDSGTYGVVDDTSGVAEDDTSGAYVVLGSTSVPVSTGSGLLGSPLQSTRYG